MAFIFENIFEPLRDNDLNTAMKEAGLTSESISLSDFKDTMFSLEEALDLVAATRHNEAYPLLEKVHAKIRKSTNSLLVVTVALFTSISAASTALLSGDAKGASQSFDDAEELLKGLAQIDPTLRKSLRAIKAAGRVAVSKIELNANDVKAAELAMSKAALEYDDLFSLLDRNNEEDHPFFIEAHGTKLEGALNGAFFAIQALDPERAKNRLAHQKKDKQELRSFLPGKVTPVHLNMLNTALELYSALTVIADLTEDIVFNHAPIKHDRIQQLRTARNHLLDADRYSTAAGDRGKMYKYMISQLSTFLNQLGKAGNITEVGFGKYAGIISLISLIILMTVIHFTIEVTALTAPLLFGGALIASIITGFGVRALVFKPLISSYMDAATKLGEN